MSVLQKLLRTSPRYIALLQQGAILTPKDFLQYFPREYEDRETIKTIQGLELEEGNTQTIRARVVNKKVLPRGSKKLYEIEIIDEEESIAYITFFNSYYQYKNVELDQWYLVTGKPKHGYGKINFSHPELHKTSSTQDIGADTTQTASAGAHAVGRIYPVYSELLGIKPAWFAKNTWKLLDYVPDYFHEYLPEPFLERFDLMHVHDTIRNMHYPSSHATQQAAIRRVFFDRLLRIQLHSLRDKQRYDQASTDSQPSSSPQRSYIQDITDQLPFTLTTAQKKVVKTIVEDFYGPKPMLRLLQGDVGSGKTIVAVITAYYLMKTRGKQACFLAPLSILAQQHFQKIAKLLLPLGIRVELLAGALTAGQKRKVKEALADGRVDMIVGTHAILQEDVTFHDLGYVIVDEQHKFGVYQRGFFRNHGAPHIVQMSATPIPRSMALAFFGEFSVSVIDELPSGRKPIHTKVVTDRDWKKLIPRMEQKITQGQKVFVVAPLIEESEKLDGVKDVHSVYEEIAELFASYGNTGARMGLLHGRMKSQEKDAIMKQFKNGDINVLVSTTVIEVGVDIPEATMMIIHNAERFGLSQLHQLRGRIGRSDLQSYCFLQTHKKSGDTRKRLQAMEDTTDGFELAKIDLQYRGAGEILGTRQSGIADIPLELLTDESFMQQVHDAAQRLMDHYPDLEQVPALKKFLEEKLPGMLV